MFMGIFGKRQKEKAMSKTGQKVETIPESKDKFYIENGVLIKAVQKEIWKPLYIPEGVKEIAPDVFRNWLGPKELILPEGLEKIGARAFSNRHRLKKVQFPDSLKEIGAEAFSNAKTLLEIRLPAGVSMEKDAFAGCTRLSFVDHDHPDELEEVLCSTPFWRLRNQGEMPKELPQELIGYISGKVMVERGYLFFEEEEWYSISTPENGVVTVSAWTSTEDADSDGFGMEECYDWWLLDEQLRPIQGVPGFHDFSKNDVYVNRKEWISMKNLAVKCVKQAEK